VSAMSLALLLVAAATTAVGAAALCAAHGMRRQIEALRAELITDLGGAAAIPAARRTPAAEIRAAVADALAEERERELAEARAFWAAQEARDAADSPAAANGMTGLTEDPLPYLPRQADFAGLEKILGPDAAEVLGSIEAVDAAIDAHEQAKSSGSGESGTTDSAADSPELAAARRRHPSNRDFSPGADHERTVSRLDELATAATPLSDVRPGPLGTLDVYIFADGTTICMTPGHRETAERLAEALRAGQEPVLLGGSGVSGAYAMTFACGEENVYVLADRVIASL
jgi:hypothetical protein